MEIERFIGAMERIAPPELALGFDNPGLLIGTEKREIRRVLVALDCTPEVADEAAAGGYDLVLTHHPLFFLAVKHILPTEAETAPIYRMIRSGIGMYAAHTNLDAAEGGVSQTLAETIGLTELASFGENGICRVGMLETPMTLHAFCARVGERVHAPVKYTGDPQKRILRVATVGGQGADAMKLAKAEGADALVTGECAHHEALASNVLDIALLIAGHYETESLVLPRLIARLQNEPDDVQYSLAHSDRSPFTYSLGGIL